MKRWLLTVVRISRATRRRVGKARVVAVDSDRMDPLFVERDYERAWDDRHTSVKVVDVREAT